MPHVIPETGVIAVNKTKFQRAYFLLEKVGNLKKKQTVIEMVDIVAHGGNWQVENKVGGM